MRLSPCDCDPSHWRRVPRKWWMKAFDSRARYRCSACHATMLVRNEAPRISHLLFRLAAGLLAASLAWVATDYWEAHEDAMARRNAEAAGQ